MYVRPSPPYHPAQAGVRRQSQGPRRPRFRQPEGSPRALYVFSAQFAATLPRSCIASAGDPQEFISEGDERVARRPQERAAMSCWNSSIASSTTEVSMRANTDSTPRQLSPSCNAEASSWRAFSSSTISATSVRVSA